MTNQNLFRLAGWLAIVFIALAFSMFAFTGGTFIALSILGGVCLAVIFYALRSMCFTVRAPRPWDWSCWFAESFR